MALTVALLVTAASAQSGSTKEPTLAGSWVVYVTPAPESGIPPFVNLSAFTKDGRIINSSPDGAWVGEWIKTGPRQSASTFMGFTKVGEDFLLFKVRATAEVDESGDTFAAPLQTDIFDGEGNVVITFTGTVRATRFGVEPLE
jgi:hypothetical protein